MTKNNDTKSKQLGMPIGTASGILRKAIMFDLVKRLGENICFQCGEEIENVDEFSIEHKEAWLHSKNPIELFFSLDNIAFSHISCNVRVARKIKPTRQHGTTTMYHRGKCRCEKCKEVMKVYFRKYRSRKVS